VRWILRLDFSWAHFILLYFYIAPEFYLASFYKDNGHD